MTAVIPELGDPEADGPADADEYAKAAKGWVPPLAERYPLWPRIAEQRYDADLLARMEYRFTLAEHLIVDEQRARR